MGQAVLRPAGLLSGRLEQMLTELGHSPSQRSAALVSCYSCPRPLAQRMRSTGKMIGSGPGYLMALGLTLQISATAPK